MKRRFGHLAARPPGGADEVFLEALYLDAREDLGALPVPRGVIEGIARHQRRMQVDDYARRYPDAQAWLLEDEGRPVGRLVLDVGETLVRVVDLSVARGARRRGIARTVLGALQETHGGIALRVGAGNAPARALYAALGFAVRRDDGATLELGWGSGQVRTNRPSSARSGYPCSSCLPGRCCRCAR